MMLCSGNTASQLCPVQRIRCQLSRVVASPVLRTRSRTVAHRASSRAMGLRCCSGPEEGTTVREIEAWDGDERVQATFEVPTASSLITVALEKPLGLQLEERNGDIVVDDIIYGGNAEKSGVVQKGDILRGVTARVVEGAAPRSVGGFNRSKESLFGKLVLMDTKGESFDTTMAAIASNRCSQCAVTIVLQREMK
eukprot:CAMPEP_0118934400 /NCGR_PEP_ID=MMETSP1169-20130426/13804_1 /TAXON_ID=36882 /ORGANISM="Pyramimonas obovata, Strain CCMP722" /LENGTH=194 /DNA_ID=CAMNT_0006877303 /DNA_START=27 /DNA_END=611 /DNA_ORIENTATION=+